MDMRRNHRWCTTTHPDARALGLLIALLLPTAVSVTFGTEDALDLLGRLGMFATFIVALLTLYWGCTVESGRSSRVIPPHRGRRQQRRGGVR